MEYLFSVRSGARLKARNLYPESIPFQNELLVSWGMWKKRPHRLAFRRYGHFKWTKVIDTGMRKRWFSVFKSTRWECCHFRVRRFDSQPFTSDASCDHSQQRAFLWWSSRIYIVHEGYFRLRRGRDLHETVLSAARYTLPSPEGWSDRGCQVLRNRRTSPTDAKEASAVDVWV